MTYVRAILIASAVAGWYLVTPGSHRSQITQRPFVIGPRIKGTVTVVSNVELDGDGVSRWRNPTS